MLVHSTSLGAPMLVQETGLPPVAGAPVLGQGTPFPGAYMASPSWPMSETSKN